MSRPRIHLIAPAGSARPFLEAMGFASGAELLEATRRALSDRYDVTGETDLLEAGEDVRHGGRRDDRERAEDITRALADDAVSAIVMVRGGAWFTRIVPRIDLGVLDRRTRPVALFGFSELTTLVNILGGHPQGRALYDMGPAFLMYGLKRYAARHVASSPPAASKTGPWVREHLGPEFAAYFRDVAAVIEGRGTDRPLPVRVLRGSEPPEGSELRLSGGNLTVLSTLVGTAYDRFVRPEGTWLVLEDFNDKVERYDRYLAHLTLAGYWTRCAGILLGDFHLGYENQTEAVAELLAFHLPSSWEGTILTSDRVGHVWPMAPLPLHFPLTYHRTADEEGVLRFDAGAVATVWTEKDGRSGVCPSSVLDGPGSRARG